MTRFLFDTTGTGLVGDASDQDLFALRGEGQTYLGLGGEDALFGGGRGNALFGDTDAPIDVSGDPDPLVRVDGDFLVVGFEDLLVGRGGGDSLYGDTGVFQSTTAVPVVFEDDLLDGGGGDDFIVGDANGNVTALTAGSAVFGGDDEMRGRSGDDQLFGDGSALLANADGARIEGGDDVIAGDAGNDTAFGDGFELGALAGTAIGGDDVIAAGRDDDIVYGDVFLMVLEGAGIAVGGGDDSLRGNLGNDTLFGDAAEFRAAPDADGAIAGGDDVLRGGRGDDVLYGDFAEAESALVAGGNDILAGGLGDDTMTGGSGADRFILSTGEDVVTDFSAAEGDVLVTRRFFDTPEEALAAVTYADGNATLAIDGTSSLLIENVAAGSLTVDDFV